MDIVVVDGYFSLPLSLEFQFEVTLVSWEIFLQSTIVKTPFRCPLSLVESTFLYCKSWSRRPSSDLSKACFLHHLPHAKVSGCKHHSVLPFKLSSHPLQLLQLPRASKSKVPLGSSYFPYPVISLRPKVCKPTGSFRLKDVHQHNSCSGEQVP